MNENVTPTPSFNIYKRSTVLRELANSIRTVLDYLQEVALNTAINSNKSSGSTEESVYQVIADVIKKNCDKMGDQLDEVDTLINALIITALDQLRYNKRVETFTNIKSDDAIQRGQKSNLDLVENAIVGARKDLLKAYKEIRTKVDSSINHQSKLQALNDKLWLTVTSLKIENNLTSNTVVFFQQLSLILDEKNHQLNNHIIEIGKGLMEIDEISKNQSRSLM